MAGGKFRKGWSSPAGWSDFGKNLKATAKQARHGLVTDTEDAVLAFHGQQTFHDWSPSLRLRLAVIEEAIATLKVGPTHKYSTAHSVHYRDTVAWVEGRIKSAPSFSLAEICEVLGVDLDTVRAHLMGYVELYLPDQQQVA